MPSRMEYWWKMLMSPSQVIFQLSHPAKLRSSSGDKEVQGQRPPSPCASTVSSFLINGLDQGYYIPVIACLTHGECSYFCDRIEKDIAYHRKSIKELSLTVTCSRCPHSRGV